MGKLTALECTKLGDGKYNDGDGLILIVRGSSRSWTYKYTFSGRRREMGLGKLAHVGLAQARKLAADARTQVQQGIDPLAVKNVPKKIVPSRAPSLRKIVFEYHDSFVDPIMTRKHSQQWVNSIMQHISNNVLDSSISNIKASTLIDILQPLYITIPETARRIRQRLDVIFDYAAVKGFVDSNPAKIIVRALRTKKQKGQFRSLPYQDIPAFMKILNSRPGVSARALSFLILTAARTEEILGCKWNEIKDDVWIVPAERMKASEEHTVYLSAQARAEIDKVRGISAEWVFPSVQRRGGKDMPMSNMAMLNQLNRMNYRDRTTVHGFRSTFSTWANENAVARPDVIEASLAHQEEDRVRKAYNRAKFISERRKLLERWAEYCCSGF